MEADELLTFAIRVLADAREEIKNYRELSTDLMYRSKVEALEDLTNRIDQLVSAIRIYQMPVCMSQPDAQKYLSGKSLK